MFDSLSDRLNGIFSKLRGRGFLNEKDVDEALREIRMALLEADVNFKVAKELMASIRERAVGHEVLKSLTPGQQVIKIVNDELVNLMGGTSSEITFSSTPITVIMLVGLQGSGKTTAAAKLAFMMRKKGKHPILVGADPYRPAAREQLEALSKELSVPFFSALDIPTLEICHQGVQAARDKGCNVVILDTAGRLHIDEDLIKEITEIKTVIKPHEILFVADSMLGQEAVNVASEFNNNLQFDGVILTKLDGDARGGAALSIKAVTGKPIKFVSLGEKPQSLEVFHPERMASRILGMGDVLTLIEKASAAVEEEDMKLMEEKMRRMEFDLEDFLKQMESIKKIGPIGDLMKMIPGFASNPQLKNLKVSDKDIGRVQAIIRSMTKEERQTPNIINGARRERISKGSGTSMSEVNNLLKQFTQAKKMMKQLGGMKKKFKGLPKLPFSQ